jgi:hypothetical protein
VNRSKSRDEQGYKLDPGLGAIIVAPSVTGGSQLRKESTVQFSVDEQMVWRVC